jgi:flavin-dependent dehydrogenase
VVVVLDATRAGEIEGDSAGFFDRTIALVPELVGAVRTTAVSATGPFDWPTRGITADGALLVGDAAGYFDPLTGQGIYRALRGARMAAAAARTGLRGRRSHTADPRPFERAHAAAFRSGSRLQRAIEAGVAHPLLFDAAAAILRARPLLADRLMRAIGDVVPPSGAISFPPLPES